LNMKKRSLILCVLLFITVSVCSCGDVIVEPKWIIGVKGADSSVFSSIDYEKLRKVTITVKKAQQDGSILEETWNGVSLKNVLGYLGVKEYSSITLTSSDNSSREYTPDMINDSLTILGTNVNGRDLKHEDGYVQAIAGNQPQHMWVQKPVRITVNTIAKQKTP